MHPENDVQVAQSPVRMADVNARTLGRLINDLVEPPPGCVVLGDVGGKNGRREVVSLWSSVIGRESSGRRWGFATLSQQVRYLKKPTED